jgi:hypothetical protein
MLDGRRKKFGNLIRAGKSETQVAAVQRDASLSSA